MSDHELVVAVDPGGHTGLVLAWDPCTDIEMIEVYQEPWEKAIDVIYEKMSNVANDPCWRTTIVVERYTITQRTLKLSRQYEALYCIGGLLVLARLFGAGIVLQTPGEAKSLVPDERLRTIGRYDAVKGKEHARDAMRHLVRWLVGTKRMQPEELLGIECP